MFNLIIDGLGSTNGSALTSISHATLNEEEPHTSPIHGSPEKNIVPKYWVNKMANVRRLVVSLRSMESHKFLAHHGSTHRSFGINVNTYLELTSSKHGCTTFVQYFFGAVDNPGKESRK